MDYILKKIISFPFKLFWIIVIFPFVVFFVWLMSEDKEDTYMKIFKELI